MTNLEEQIGLEGWVVERQHSHYSLGYWVTFVIGMLGQSVPPPPEITYVLRHNGSGERHMVTLSGDHQKSELVEAVMQMKTATLPGIDEPDIPKAAP
jgi:hypothetical protein